MAGDLDELDIIAESTRMATGRVGRKGMRKRGEKYATQRTSEEAHRKSRLSSLRRKATPITLPHTADV
jgi:hypothetical protein